MDRSTMLRDRYLALLKKALVNDLYIENEARVVYLAAAAVNAQPIDFSIVADIHRSSVLAAVEAAKAGGGTVVIHQLTGTKPIMRPDLRKVTDLSHTMIGRQRIENLHACLDQIHHDGI